MGFWTWLRDSQQSPSSAFKRAFDENARRAEFIKSLADIDERAKDSNRGASDAAEGRPYQSGQSRWYKDGYRSQQQAMKYYGKRWPRARVVPK
jgi:hypothetical protein